MLKLAQQDATVRWERQLLASMHVPLNLANISGQATGVVSSQLSASEESVFH